MLEAHDTGVGELGHVLEAHDTGVGELGHVLEAHDTGVDIKFVCPRFLY